MDGYFEHGKSVIDLAHQLVREYDEHQREQDRIEGAKRRGHGLAFHKGRWYSDDRIQHGMTGSVEYNTWQGMKQRCNNPNHKDYESYGGQGITMDPEWQSSFVAFFKFMGRRPADNMSIDRINNDGNYEPGNCRWATPTQQMNNTRKTNGDT